MSETVVNLTVIGDRSCSTTRTYLAHMRAAGYRPRRLWLVDFGVQPSWRVRLRKIAASALTVWRPVPVQDARYTELCTRLQVQAGYPPIDHTAAWQPTEYAEELHAFRARDFDDPQLGKIAVSFLAHFLDCLYQCCVVARNVRSIEFSFRVRLVAGFV
jgi:hypothetical protein